eukprot:6586188-Prymnesium_polylepis.1
MTSSVLKNLRSENGYGGGIFIAPGSIVDCQQSTISGCTAGLAAGGFYAYGGSLRVTSCEISHSHAAGEGGAMSYSG